MHLITTLGLNYPFMQRALIAALLLGAVCPLIGVVVIIRRLAFFGDAIAHSTFTGVAIGLMLGIDPSLSAVVFAALVALGMAWLQSKSALPSDTVIGVFFSGAAALGVTIISLVEGFRSGFAGLMFGDILAVSTTDLIVGGGALILLTSVLAVNWRPVLQISLNRDLARAQGVRSAPLDMLFYVALAVTVSLATRLIGVVLVTALLLVPAAAARNFSGSLKQMFGLSMAIGMSSAALGLLASFWLNTPSGPTIVLTAVLLFAVSFTAPAFGKN